MYMLLKLQDQFMQTLQFLGEEDSTNTWTDDLDNGAACADLSTQLPVLLFLDMVLWSKTCQKSASSI